ncbi:MAG: DUF2330 domain-containing protein [Candidatus Eremiobacteraeota bacterium]|nr:DUF2330 domain-containing protein [Candidatus Eremiobacteraeota bacterium]
MKKTVLLVSLFTATAVLCAQPGQSCGAFGRGRGSTAPPIRLDRQSAFLWQAQGQEHMLLSVQYSGGTDEFAWVIPVESRPQVTVEKGAPFTELRRATEIRTPVTTRGMDMSGGSKGGAPPQGVTVLEQKEEGPYNIAVLAADSGVSLYAWLKKNQFPVSKNARGQLDYYISHKYVFVAARIRNGAQSNEQVSSRLRGGTIAPMHLAFKARQLSYPLKMTAVNPGMSEMEIYVAGNTWPQDKVLKNVNAAPADLDEVRPVGGVRAQSFDLKPSGGPSFAISGPPNLANPQADLPTLARLLPKGGKLTKYNGVLGDAQRQQDLVFAAVTSGGAR